VYISTILIVYITSFDILRLQIIYCYYPIKYSLFGQVDRIQIPVKISLFFILSVCCVVEDRAL